MVASTYFKELEALNTFTPEQDDAVPRLLRSSVLYGPNASGKSTLIQALQFVEGQVLNSQKESQAGDEIDVVPFKLTAESRAADSEFEITFVEGGVRYEYGFTCNRKRFTEEWLIAYPLGRAQKWFHRVFDAEADKDVIVMHCLPAHRNHELTDEVADGRHSVIFPQAHNRLHAQKAILARLFDVA